MKYSFYLFAIILPVILNAQLDSLFDNDFVKSHNNSMLIEIDDFHYKNLSGDFNYPLNNNDFWEYILVDTSSFMDVYYGLKHSEVKEIIGDTLMPNGLSYKIIKWSNCANSINKLVNYEFQRKDTIGRVFTYHNNKDVLIFDFDMNIGDTYPAQYEGYYFRVSRKYLVTGFNNKYKAVDLYLYDVNSNYRRSETIIENFGLTYFIGDPYNNSNLPEGSFFGGIINDTTFGYLLARKQEIDWSEFYPLHIGDFWKYEGYSGLFNTISIYKIIKDTLMPDNNFYKLIEYDNYGGPYSSNGFVFSRLDSNGSVISWDSFNQTPKCSFKFSTCLGDTFNILQDGVYVQRINDKDYNSFRIYDYPDIVYSSSYFNKGLGLYESTIEGGYKILVGAVINGKAYGDTTVTYVHFEDDNNDKHFQLFQNYPNPFNPATTIKYALPAESNVELKIYDLMGKEMRTMVNGYNGIGYKEIMWDGKNEAGTEVSSGIYLYRIVAKSLEDGKTFEKSAKMILMK